MEERIILVDEEDNEIGSAEKMGAHQKGLLHRAFSILIFDKEGRMLLQKRASDKYHCGGLWTNACCSHPRKGEDLKDAIHRRLVEEMGFDTDLKEEFTIAYKAEFENGLTEHEIDHVFIGEYDGEPKSNPEEVEDYKWVTIDELKKDIEKNPKKYTPWFRLIVDKIK